MSAVLIAQSSSSWSQDIDVCLPDPLIITVDNHIFKIRDTMLLGKKEYIKLKKEKKK